MDPTNPQAGDSSASAPLPVVPEATVAPSILPPDSVTPPIPPIGSTPNDIHAPPRRDVVAAILAILCGTVAGVFPVLAGIPVILNPLRKRPGRGGDAAKFPSLRVATIGSLPADGRPVAVPVIADKVDAWTREAGQPIGAVFLRKVADGVECFNAICPHAGCMVAFSGERNVFQCPCHTSSFELDGARVMPSPSPRDMDKLNVDAEKLKQGEIWVEFVNYYPGKANQEPKG